MKNTRWEFRSSSIFFSSSARTFDTPDFSLISAFFAVVLAFLFAGAFTDTVSFTAFPEDALAVVFLSSFVKENEKERGAAGDRVQLLVSGI